MESWESYLNDHEREIMEELYDWINRPPTVLEKGMRLLGKPVDLAYRLVPGGVKEALGGAIYKALTGLSGTTGYTISRQGLLDKLSARLGFDVGTHPGQIFQADLRNLDPLAMESLNFNRRAAAVEGGAAGAAGLPGLVVDIPALYGLVFRVIQEVAICYGFPVDGPAEHTFMLKVLDVGHYLEDDKKRSGMEELASLQEMIARGVPLKDVERFALAKGLQVLARELSVALARRKLAQSVAIVGGVVGAGVNYALVSDVGYTAYHAYRRRFLMEVAERRRKRRQAFRSGELRPSEAPVASEQAGSQPPAGAPPEASDQAAPDSREPAGDQPAPEPTRTPVAGEAAPGPVEAPEGAPPEPDDEKDGPAAPEPVREVRTASATAPDREAVPKTDLHGAAAARESQEPPESLPGAAEPHESAVEATDSPGTAASDQALLPQEEPAASDQESPPQGEHVAPAGADSQEPAAEV